MSIWFFLAAGTGLDSFDLSEYGIFGVIIGVLLMAIRHLYNDKTKTQEKYEQRETEQNEKFYQLTLNMHSVMAETLLYLKLVHKERTTHYEEYLSTLHQGTEAKRP